MKQLPTFLDGTLTELDVSNIRKVFNKSNCQQPSGEMRTYNYSNKKDYIEKNIFTSQLWYPFFGTCTGGAHRREPIRVCKFFYLNINLKSEGK